MDELITKDAIGELKMVMETLPAVSCPLKHDFTPGMYIREITMPAGTCVISKQHLTTHPYVILEGVLAVYNTEDHFLGYLYPGIRGVTKPGTVRLLKIIETTRWVTFHALDFITGEENGWDEVKKQDLVERIELLLVGETVDLKYT